MADIQKTILSGVQQSTFASYADAQAAGYKGKLLFARVEGTGYGADADGNLAAEDDSVVKGQTYVFMGKKCYGSFPQLPLELINALGLTVGEVNSGTVSSLTKYYKSTDIVNILKEIAEKNVSVVSPDKTINIGIKDLGEGMSATTVDVNIDNVSIISAKTGVLSVAPSALPFVDNFVLDANSNKVMSGKVEQSVAGDDKNMTISLGLKGGNVGQVIKVAADGTSYEWADPAGVTLNGKGGVTVSAGTAENGITPYDIFSNLYISANTSSVESGVARTYTLVDKDGKQYGESIKTINDVFLKSVEVTEQNGVKGMLFTWYVRSEKGETANKTTFIPLTDLDSYTGSDAIDVDADTNVISLIKSAEEGNLIQILEDGVYVSAVTGVTINGEKQTSESVEFDHIVSAITGTIGGVEFTADVTEGGVATIKVNPTASGVVFTNEVIPVESGTNVQTVVENIYKELSESTEGVLTITNNDTEVGTYNPTEDATINIPTLSALTIGAESFVITNEPTGISGAIDSISATAITYTYNGTGNTTFPTSASTAQDTFTEIINRLDNATVSGLSAIVSNVTESGTTVELKLNESNTKSQADRIIPSNEGYVAVADDLTDATKSSNAVKMSQSAQHGLFVYIEIQGDDMDDDIPTQNNVMYYEVPDGVDGSNAFNVQGTPVND